MDFRILSEYVDSLEDSFGVPACDIAVWQDHRPIYRHYYGFTDADGRRSMEGRELYWMYSVTKLFTASLVLRLWERGLISPENGVSDYLPEFSCLTVREGGTVRPARERLTLYHLLTMQSGISYRMTTELRRMQKETGKAGTNRDVVRAIAAAPLDFEPGSHFLYGYSHDVLAAVCEEVTGKDFPTLMREELLDGLEIRDAGFVPGEAERKRFPVQYTYSFREKQFSSAGGENTAQLTSGHRSGGAGLYCSLDGVMRLADALSCGGTAANGYRVLRPETVEKMRTNVLGKAQMRDFAAIGTVKPGYGYGLGVRTLVDPATSRGPVGEFGWSGAAGSYVLCDPVNRMSLVYTQHVLDFMPAFDEIHNGLRDRLYEAMDM